MSRSRESSLGSVAMEEEEDDLYGASPGANGQTSAHAAADELESGEEEEEDDESDIEIVTERPDLGPEPTTASRTNQKGADPSQQSVTAGAASHQQSLPSRAAPTTIRISADTSAPVAVTKPILLPGDKYPAIRTTSTAQLDLDNVPLWNGKPITDLDIDADLAESMKPWRRPGADQAEYFNYGFDEFSWALYCEKQKAMRAGIEEQRNENKMFEQMMGMPSMPGAGAAPSGGGSGGNDSPMPGMPGGTGMPGMPGEQDMMQMMMQYMQATGKTDPSQVDFAEMMSQFGMGGMPGGVPTGPSAGAGQQQQGGWGGQQQGAYGGSGGGRRGRRGW